MLELDAFGIFVKHRRLPAAASCHVLRSPLLRPAVSPETTRTSTMRYFPPAVFFLRRWPSNKVCGCTASNLAGPPWLRIDVHARLLGVGCSPTADAIRGYGVAAWIACHTRDALAGISSSLTPSGASASRIAIITDG